MTHLPLFRYVEIHNFRGFRSLQRIEFNASAVIVIGPNGTGKTSLFDAIQWLLLGSLPRLSAIANPRSRDYLVNHWSETGPASVAAELQTSDRRVYVRRRGNASNSRLELRDSEGVYFDVEAQTRLASFLLVRTGVSLQN